MGQGSPKALSAPGKKTAGKGVFARPPQSVALAHDYVTQRGGAERVVLAMARAFPDAPLHTSLYDPDGTFPEFADIDTRTTPLNGWGPLRRNHRLALPFLAKAVDGHAIESDVVLASSSGWAHGFPTSGRKIVYCHAPARWLYQTDRYVGGTQAHGLRSRAVDAAARLLGPGLREWDQRAVATADRYIVNSTVIQRQVREVYGINAEVLPPPPAAFDRRIAASAVPGVEKPYVLCVARLMPYKNVDAVIEAVARIPGVDLVVVGDGPDRSRLDAIAARVGHTRMLGRVSDAELRWLYENSFGLVAASYEDFGLSPLEAASFGKPTAALRDGGYLDTVVEGRTGVFFDAPVAEDIARGVESLVGGKWDAESIVAHAGTFSEARFAARLREVVAEELA